MSNHLIDIEIKEDYREGCGGSIQKMPHCDGSAVKEEAMRDISAYVGEDGLYSKNYIHREYLVVKMRDVYGLEYLQIK